MELVSKFIIGVSFVVVSLMIVGAVVLLNGGIPVSRDTHPPCEQLPTLKEATVALAENQVFAEEIQALGNGIMVEVGNPCLDEQDRGLVMVKYNLRSERD